MARFGDLKTPAGCEPMPEFTLREAESSHILKTFAPKQTGFGWTAEAAALRWESREPNESADAQEARVIASREGALRYSRKER